MSQTGRANGHLVGHDGRGNYSCGCCGHRWRAGKRYLWWPVKLRWKWGRLGRWNWFGWHGWQVGFEGLERRVFGWAFHLGPVLLLFGPEEWRGDCS
jgi:hypothetical protein